VKRYFTCLPLYNVKADVTYHFYAIGYDADGNEDMLVHVAHTPRVPYGDNLSVEVSVPAETIGENSAKAVIAGQGGIDQAFIAVYSKSVLDNYTSDEIFRSVALYPESVVSMNGSSEKEYEFGDLLPDSEYVICCVGMSADGK
jgi:hypothetical protein